MRHLIIKTLLQICKFYFISPIMALQCEPMRCCPISQVLNGQWSRFVRNLPL